MNHKAKDELINFLERKVFDPVLEKPPEKYPPEEREKLERVQEATDRAKHRYYCDYESATEVYEHFRDDLRSDKGREIQQLSRELGLPSFQDVAAGFEEVARREGITR